MSFNELELSTIVGEAETSLFTNFDLLNQTKSSAYDKMFSSSTSVAQPRSIRSPMNSKGKKDKVKK